MCTARLSIMGTAETASHRLGPPLALASAISYGLCPYRYYLVRQYNVLLYYAHWMVVNITNLNLLTNQRFLSITMLESLVLYDSTVMMRAERNKDPIKNENVAK
jgi:hypothetical protein